jgi:hypothetical protein
MKAILTTMAAAIPLLIAGPAFPHHAAEGIVTDDIFTMIDENLLLVDSPHLEMDLSTVGTASDSMSVLTVTVASEDMGEILQTVSDAVSDALMGQGVQVESPLEISISEPDSEGLVTITVEENIGQGQSQMP